MCLPNHSTVTHDDDDDDDDVKSMLWQMEMRTVHSLTINLQLLLTFTSQVSKSVSHCGQAVCWAVLGNLSSSSPSPLSRYILFQLSDQNNCSQSWQIRNSYSCPELCNFLYFQETLPMFKACIDVRQSAVLSLTGRYINSARAQFLSGKGGSWETLQPSKWKLKQSGIWIKQQNCHSLTVPNCPVACSKLWIQRPLEAPLCASADRWSRARRSNSLALSLSRCLPLLCLCLSRSWPNKHEVMVTAALWYNSASGRGDAPESNTVSSTELIAQRESEREALRGRRGVV